MPIPRVGIKTKMKCQGGPLDGHTLVLVTGDSTLRFSLNGMTGRYFRKSRQPYLIWREC